jgi:hypothetical protein
MKVVRLALQILVPVWGYAHVAGDTAGDFRSLSWLTAADPTAGHFASCGTAPRRRFALAHSSL